MFKNYLIIIIRNVFRQKSFSFINVTGLAVGMACCLLIMLWVQDELSYDRYHKKAGNICRITFEFVRPGNSSHFARVPYGWINSLPELYPEVLDMVRFHHELKVTVRNGDLKYNETNFFNVDPNVFDVFSFKLLQGDPQTVLSEPGAIVISEYMVKKYFGGADPIGQTLTTVNRYLGDETEYIVTGILENTPANSHFHIDFLIPQTNRREELVDNWNYTYVLLADGADPAELALKFPKLVEERMSGWLSKPIVHIQKLTDIHLQSDLDREIESNGNIESVYIFLIIAGLILLIGCINFMNLSTAKSSQRALEIGIRKTLGSFRGQLIKYFLGESILLSICALLIAFVLIELTLPLFNNFTGKELTLLNYENKEFMIGLILFPFIIGILAGSYPALYLSSLKPVNVLKAVAGSSNLSKSGGFGGRVSMRNFLVIFQFAISIALIIGCVITYTQHNFLMANRLGSYGEQIIAISNLPVPAKQRYGNFKNELSGNSEIIDITTSMEPPSRQILDAFPYTIDGVRKEDEVSIIFAMPVEENFLRFYDGEIIVGRDFPPGPIDTNKTNYILNESGVNLIGFDTPAEAIGHEFFPVQQWATLPAGPIIGVVEDFHFSNLRKKIKPLVYFQKSAWYWCILIKINPDNMPAALAAVEKTWEKINPEYPFEYNFVDDLYASIYKAEQKQGTILGLFSLLAVFIACLGLFGLASYTVERRTKEIGIRKVHGAGISQIVFLLTKDFIRWVIIANIIAWPLAYYVMQKWLDNFAYRINIGWTVFVMAAAAALIIALLTISFQSIKAARANPVKTLRYE